MIVAILRHIHFFLENALLKRCEIHTPRDDIVPKKKQFQNQNNLVYHKNCKLNIFEHIEFLFVMNIVYILYVPVSSSMLTSMLNE